MINDPLSLIVGVKTTFSLKVVRSKTCIDKNHKTLYPSQEDDGNKLQSYPNKFP